MHALERLAFARFIVNFPTKQSWRHPSRIEFTRDGLVDLRRVIIERGVRSIALPALGCGLGGLAWAEVEPLIHGTLGDRESLAVVVFPPQGNFLEPK